MITDVKEKINTISIDIEADIGRVKILKEERPE